MAQVKLSLLLSEPVHHELKLIALHKKTSLQRIMQNAAEQITNPSTTSAVAASGAALGSTGVLQAGKREIRVWQDKLKQVFESGDSQAIDVSVASLAAALALIEIRKDGSRNGEKHTLIPESRLA